MGTASIGSFALLGVEAVPVSVEAHVRPGLPGVAVVGLPDAAVREAKERVRSAASVTGFPLPTQRITVGLSPADVRKEGPGFDLPLALAVLVAAGYAKRAELKGVAAVGELGLQGEVRRVRGVLAMAEAAAAYGLHTFLVPIENLAEANAAAASSAIGVRSLAEALAACSSVKVADRLRQRGQRWLAARKRRMSAPGGPELHQPDLADVAGHAVAKRALEIAAAGGHHVLMVGPPGVGKTMLARRMPGILPPLSASEARQVTKIWSAAGLLGPSEGIMERRPFRSPHHTASTVSLVGGGTPPRPGEVTLAHHGVLFLDEFPEFARDALEALREPLEEGHVVISRRTGSVYFPARFTLIAAMNPCPCGYAGHPTVACTCSPGYIERYRRQISGPLLDRVDIMLEIPPVSVEVLASKLTQMQESSEEVRARVVQARAFAAERRELLARSSMLSGAIASPCRLELEAAMSPGAVSLLHRVLTHQRAGGRSHARLVSLSRTIADLDQSTSVREEHVAEAASLHLRDRLSWQP